MTADEKDALDALAHQTCITLTNAAPGKPEASFCYDLKSGEDLGTDIGTSNMVGVSPKAKLACQDYLRDVKIAHSHPDARINVSLSNVDLHVLWLCPGVTEIDAVTLEGSWFRARRGEEFPIERKDLALSYIKHAFLSELHVPKPTAPGLAALYREAKTHLMCRVLYKTGIIVYSNLLSNEASVRWHPHAAALEVWESALLNAYLQRPKL